MPRVTTFIREHRRLTRRYFLQSGAAGAAALAILPKFGDALPPDPVLANAIEKLEDFFTAPEKFRDVSRGKPIPHTLSEEQQTAVGMTRETWKLEVVADADHPARIKKPLTKDKGTALDFASLLQLGEKHAVRFAKVMTCLNIGCPLGMGIWEGVPLREVIWRSQPSENLRRVFYYGFHNNDAKQMFRSSLPIDRVLEDPFDLPPVILCYKLNGQWLSPERGGPVRIVVPEAYGFKSIKWLSHVMLTNLAHANDTYADGNNDLESPLKTFAATFSVPKEIAATEPFPITGYAQVGIAGLSKVQVWICKSGEEPQDDPNFATANWRDAEVLQPPKSWANLPDARMPADTIGFDADGRPRIWPMRLGKVHWAVLLPGLPAGEYTLRSRTVDGNGHPQPMPRPFRKSGHAAIEQVSVVVK